MAEKVQIALLGAGIFATTEYIPRLSELTDVVTLKSIWSRTEESARKAVEIAKKHSLEVECKWGDAGLNDIISDASIVAVIVVLAAPYQVDMSFRMLEAGKHVLQEKPAAASVTEVESALTRYKNFGSTASRHLPIWAIAENFRFEPAFVEAKKSMAGIGKMINFQMIVEYPMSSSNPYFSTPWRHSYTGGYILEGGVHFAAALRMLTGCEVDTVTALAAHVDTTLPPPDNMCSIIRLENGCTGVYVNVISGKAVKVSLRFVGTNGTMNIGLENSEGQYGLMVRLQSADGREEKKFYPRIGVSEELKAFFHDVSLAADGEKDGGVFEPDPRLSYVEGGRDVAVLEAMLESAKTQGNMKVQRI